MKTVLGRPVCVKLNSGIEYRGVLACLDGYLNIAMEQTEEYFDGQLKAKYGDCFIRGNNGKLFDFVAFSKNKYPFFSYKCFYLSQVLFISSSTKRR